VSTSTFKTVLLWLTILVALFLVWHVAQMTKKDATIKFSEFMADVESGKIADVTITGNDIRGKFSNSEPFRTTAPASYDKLMDALLAKNVPVTVQSAETPTWANMLISSAPFILLIGFWIFFMRQMQSGGNKALSFGKSKAKLLASQQKKVTFKDVAGVDEAKEELQEIIEFLREPQKFQKLGGRIPKGVLLMGPPGTGKTLLARAIAGEANVPFFSISGSDFVEMFVGVGASRVRDLFEQGKKNAPCIIFIDEIDAVGRHRGAGLGGGHDEREQTLNQLLVEMDGFESNDGVILIAATNRPDVLDPALLRPGRFDRQVVVARPDVKGREEILKVHARRVPLAPKVDLKVLARGTPGFSGADLANLVNEAALFAARFNKRLVDMDDFERAKDKIIMGAERRSMVMPEEERRNTAYHESGHALVARLLPKTDPVHKVTIIPRGRALGYTSALPTEDKFLVTRAEMLDQLAMLLGGRTAEELIFHEPTTGAANDIEKATQIARGMITEYGMSERLGARKFGNGDGEPFLGRDMSHSRDYSDEIASSIDEEIHRLIESAHDEAWEVLVQYRDVLDALVLRLLDKETVARTEVLEIFATVEKRPVRGSYTGYGKRLPSDRPPVLSPKELALAAADGGGGSNGNNMALPANGQSFGFTPSDNEPSDTE
jgi:cell division protease FtsH